MKHKFPTESLVVTIIIKTVDLPNPWHVPLDTDEPDFAIVTINIVVNVQN